MNLNFSRTMRPHNRMRWLSGIAILAMIFGLIPGVNVGGASRNAALAAGTPAVSSTAGTYGFPDWYQDANGIRVQPCLNAADPNCIVLADATFDPALPLVFPTNFPGEFFYFVADSDKITTPGCAAQGWPALDKGAFMRVAMEGSFVNGRPVTGDQITFGRIRIVVKTHGLCPNTTYTFTHPYGTETITTHADGGVPANKAGFTEDIGCLAAPCDFSLALTSRVFGGFLQFDPAFNVPPAGYLGDAVTLSPVIGSPNNIFSIADGTGVIAQTNLFTVSGKKAGPLMASPSAVDFGGQTVGSTSAATTITITNVDPTSITPAPAAITGANAADFAIANDACQNVPLAQDQSCAISVTFTPNAVPPAVETAQLGVAHNGSFGSPLTVALTGASIETGAAPVVSLSTTSLTFGNQRVRTTSAAQTVTVSNTGNAPLSASVTIGGADASQFVFASDSCSGAFVAAGASCAVSVKFAPTAAAAFTASLNFTDNAAGSPHSVSLSGTGTGGIAAVSTTLDPNGFPDWYQDENGVQVQPCIQGADANCILPGPPNFDPNQPTVFPTNFPDEFFYWIADSDKITTPGCAAQGWPALDKGAFMRVAVEGTFATGAVIAGDQITFGRIRIVVKPGGLCPNTTYIFTHPYGTELITTHADGGVPANKAGFTEDIGCLAAPCDFSLALTSRVFEGFLQFDPAFNVPPAGYLGDAVTLSPVIGSPTGNNLFSIADGTGIIAQTNLFTVSGKKAMPITAAPRPLTFGSQELGTTSATQNVTLTNNDPVNSVDISTATIIGLNAADYSIPAGSDLCSGQTLAPAGTCTIGVAFTPSAAGPRAAALSVAHSGNNTPVQVRLSGTGLPPNQPPVAVNDSATTIEATAVNINVLTNDSDPDGNLPLTVANLTQPASGTAAVQPDNTVMYTPNAGFTGSDSFTYQAVDSLGATSNVATVAITVNAVPVLTVAPTSLDFGGVQRDTNSLPQTVTFTNLGTVSVNLTAVNFTGDFSRTGGTCAGTLAPNGGTCTVEVTFHPIAPDGSKTGTLSLVHSGANSPLPVTLAGVGTPPPFAVAEVTPASLAFGEQRVNTASTAQTITVRNTGTVPLNVLSVGVSGTNASDFLRTNKCPAVVPVGGQCTIDVVFQPSATGARSATLTITANTSPAATTVALSGTGVLPVSTVTPASLAFGSQLFNTTSAAQTVTVRNSGTGQMLVSGVSLTGANPTSFTFTNNCTASLGPNQSCTIDVRFAPKAAGALSASLRITSNTAQSPQSVALSGTGTAPTVSLSSTSLSFGNVQLGRNSSKALTIQNKGTAPLIFTSFTISGTNAAEFTITQNTCAGVTIAVNGKCSITVRFAPTAVGTRTANLVLVDNAVNSPQTVPLTGNGR